jgi:hypothetical protein
MLLSKFNSKALMLIPTTQESETGRSEVYSEASKISKSLSQNQNKKIKELGLFPVP